MRDPVNRRKAGFTLVELLVVIAIITVLISILLPALSRARDQANTVRCSSNLRQIGQAMISYTFENKGSFPPASMYDSTYYLMLASWDGLISADLGTKTTWNPLMGPQPVDIKVLHCPSDDLPADPGYGPSYFRDSYAMATSPPWAPLTSVSTWGEVIPQTWAPDLANAPWCPYFRTVKTSEVRSSSSTIMVAEHFFTLNLQGLPWGSNVVGPQCGAADGGSPCQVELGNPNVAQFPAHANKLKWNYLFVDGHVDTLNPSQTIGTGTLSSPQGMWVRQ